MSINILFKTFDIPLRAVFTFIAIFVCSLFPFRTEASEHPENDGDPETTHYPASMASGTLPIVNIATADCEPVIEKEKKIDASLWIEVQEDGPYQGYGLGDETSPMSITIKGRGNSTWLLDKKPYTIKFSKKTSLFGLPKHKSYALLACALEYPDWMSQAVGKDLARMMDLGWAPRYHPVELVLNGEYEGLYFLFETVKIDPNRLDIFEQEDENTDPATIPYGWLVEIDNYADEAQVIIPYGGRGIRVTHKSPEVLSEQQRAWLIEEFTYFTSILHSEHPEQWDQFIEPHSMAKYFIVREVMNDSDGFNGSIYMYRDNTGDLRWHMGPMWDNCIYNRSVPSDWVMNELPEWAFWKILPIIFYTPNFKEVFLEEWDKFYPRLAEIKPILIDLADQCKVADKANQQRWHTANTVSAAGAEHVYSLIEAKANWIEANKDYDLNASAPIVNSSPFTPYAVEYYTTTGQRLAAQPESGLYIQRTINSDGTVSVSKLIK